MMTRWLYFLALIFGLICTTTTTAGTETRQPDTLLLKDHPLVDRVFDVHNKRTIDTSRLFEKLASAGYILLGEVHDNISHHRNQAMVIDSLAAGHRVTGVAFEMIDDSQGKFIKDRQFTSADELIGLLNHVDAGWDYEHYYRPVFDSVIRAGFRIYPANITRNMLTGIVMRHGADIPEETSRILSTTVFTPELNEEMQKDIIEAHCDMLDAAQATPMVQAQRIRDATMAASLLHSGSGPVILIAGNGHVRRDSGVPRYLLSQDEAADIVSVAMVEVIEDQDEISAYAGDWGDDGLPFDYVWFTARADREDPCIEFIRQHKKQ